MAALGLLSDQAGPGAELTREEAGLGQQDEADHNLDPQPQGAGLVLEHQPVEADPALEHLLGEGHGPGHLLDVGLVQEHQPEGVGLGLEHLPGADLGPGHQCDGDLVVDHQPGEVEGHALEPQPGGGGRVLEPQLDAVVARALELQPDVVVGHALELQQGEGDLGPGHQQDEDLVVEVWLDVEDLILEHHKEEAGLVHHRRGRTNPEHLKEGVGLTQAQKLKNLVCLQGGAGLFLHHDPKQNLACL